MSSFKRSVRRNRIRRVAQATGIPMRHLWRAHQSARNIVRQREIDGPTPWYQRTLARVAAGLVMAAVIAYLIITMSIGSV